MATPPASGSPVDCSGPMFSVGDLNEQAQVAAALEAANFTTYLPQRDGIEVGTVMAFAAGKPIVIYKTTPLSMLGGFDDPMVQGLSTIWQYVSEVTKVPEAVSAALAANAALKGTAFSAGPHLDAVLKLGAAVWGLVPEMHAASNDTPAQLYAAVQALEKLLGPLVAVADGDPAPPPAPVKAS